MLFQRESVEAAIKSAVAEASKTIEHNNQINVSHIEGIVEKNQVTKFRVNSKISFVVKH